MKRVAWGALFGCWLWAAPVLGSDTPRAAAQVPTFGGTVAQSPGAPVPEPPLPDPARDAKARHLFEAGRSAYQQGDYQQGLQYFEQAYRHSPRPGLLFNIGQAAYRLRVDDKALHAFRTYLDQMPLAPNRAEVEQRIREIEQLHGAANAPSYVPPARAARSGGEPLWAWPQNSTIADQPPASSEPITKKWWFWTTIGVIVIGGTVTAVVLAT